MADTADESAAWVRQAQAGDLAAFEQLVRRHQSRVRLQLRRLARGDDALADDLAQDCFVQAWRQLPAFRGEARFSTWLHRIACNAFLMHARRRQELPWPPVAAGEAHFASAFDTAAVPGGAASAVAWGDDGAAAREDAFGRAPDAPLDLQAARRIDVERAIDALSEPQRLAIVHCFVLDLGHEEAARVLGWPLGTLKSHVSRAKLRLGERLAAWKPEGL